LLSDLDFFDGLVNDGFFNFENITLLSSLTFAVTFYLVLEEFAHLELFLLFLDFLMLLLLLVQERIVCLKLIPHRDWLMEFLAAVWMQDVNTISLFTGFAHL
jgi:hypothetical protein